MTLSPLRGLAYKSLAFGSLPTLDQPRAHWLPAEPLVPTPPSIAGNTLTLDFSGAALLFEYL